MKLIRSSPIVWALLAVPCALILGYVGYRSIPSVTMSRSDALFSSLQLFALEGSVNPHGTPWSLNVARFLAPLAVAYATVIAALAILRDQLQVLMVALCARNHVVVIGLSRAGALLARSFMEAGQQVVVVEADASNERITGVRAQGARVIIGDAAQAVILRKAGAGRAVHVVVGTGDDSRNLEIGEQARALALHQHNQRTTVHVAVADLDLWTELGRLHLGRSETGVVLEFYNGLDRAAQAVLNEAERGTGPDALRSVIVEGDGVLGQRLLVHLVRRAVMSGVHPQILMSQATAKFVLSPLSDREPWILSAATMTVEQRSPVDSSAAVAFVCLTSSDASAIARGLAFSHRPERKAVYVAVQGQQTDALLESTGAAAVVHLVPLDFDALSDQFLRQSGRELMARVRHEAYVAEELAKGATSDRNPSLVSWEDLPEPLKESNRRFAESVSDVIQALGGRLVPLREFEGQQEILGSGDILERLARDEHDRWMAALHRDGWTYSSGPKDPQRKLHPLLVPWAELPEDEKEKDRDAIRAIPRMLARVGFALEVPNYVRVEPAGLPSTRRVD